jgi:hypothetical protein
MPLSEKFTTVTTFSKIIALILFISLPFIGFLLGMRYQKFKEELTCYYLPPEVTKTKTVTN